MMAQSDASVIKKLETIRQNISQRIGNKAIIWHQVLSITHHIAGW